MMGSPHDCAAGAGEELMLQSPRGWAAEVRDNAMAGSPRHLAHSALFAVPRSVAFHGHRPAYLVHSTLSAVQRSVAFACDNVINTEVANIVVSK